jgi:hypothetical protein
MFYTIFYHGSMTIYLEVVYEYEIILIILINIIF